MLTGGVGVARCGLLTTHPGGGCVPGSPRQIMTDSGSCGTQDQHCLHGELLGDFGTLEMRVKITLIIKNFLFSFITFQSSKIVFSVLGIIVDNYNFITIIKVFLIPRFLKFVSEWLQELSIFVLIPVIIPIC